jgi:hypothetical protein
MPKNLFRIPGMLMIVCLQVAALHSQCLVAPPAPACTGTGPLAVNGETLNAGTTKWWYGASATIDNLTLNGGELIVCGNLTIDKLTFNAGTLFVLPGASFVIGGGIGTTLQLQGGCYVYNYGTVTCYRNLALDNAHVSAVQPNVFINAGAASVLDISYSWFVINNPWSWFVNNGKASFHGIITDPLSSAGSVCLGDKSQTYQTVLINNAANAYATPAGLSCLSVNEHSYLCNRVTADPGLNACLGAAHITDSSCMVSAGKPNAWGSAYLMKNCATCAGLVLLPVNADHTDTRNGLLRPPAGSATHPTAYPNPFSDHFYVALPAGSTSARIVITNMPGEIIWPAHTNDNGKGLLEIYFRRRLPPGLYTLQINTGKALFVQKLLKQ